ncbi:hypothetical protein VTK73DRAFT_9426 [Phialemonium thermophilum]|uniref:Aldo/keto reductase n=1 Tax=Phialemonium thermophilum TaxID=223376 RepID=A0ABR3W2C3_9PEZI
MAWPEPRKTGMLYRRLGNSGLHVSVLGLGGWLTFGGHVDNGTPRATCPNDLAHVRTEGDPLTRVQTGPSLA